MEGEIEIPIIAVFDCEECLNAWVEIMENDLLNDEATAECPIKAELTALGYKIRPNETRDSSYSFISWEDAV